MQNGAMRRHIEDDRDGFAVFMGDPQVTMIGRYPFRRPPGAGESSASMGPGHPLVGVPPADVHMGSPSPIFSCQPLSRVRTKALFLTGGVLGVVCPYIQCEGGGVAVLDGDEARAAVGWVGLVCAAEIVGGGCG